MAEPNNNEYGSRMYSTGHTEERANRISGYLFNAVGGQGTASYFQKGNTNRDSLYRCNKWQRRPWISERLHHLVRRKASFQY